MQQMNANDKQDPNAICVAHCNLDYDYFPFMTRTNYDLIVFTWKQFLMGKAFVM